MLLDEAFAKPAKFPRLTKKTNLTHILDFGFSRQIEDKNIYNFAVKENRFVVTINFKDFKKLDIDLVLSDFVSKHHPQEFFGKAVKINEEDALKIKKYR